MDSRIFLLPLIAALLASVAMWRRDRLARRQAQARNDRLQQQLTEQRLVEERLRDFSEVANDWGWETDGRHIVTYASAKIAQILGVTLEDLIGRHRDLMLSAMQNDDSKQMLKAYIDRSLPFHDLTVTLRPNAVRGERKARLSGRPRFDVEGRFQGYRGIATDITSTVQAAIEAAAIQNKLLRAIEASPGAFCLFDADDRLLAWNLKYASYFVDDFQLRVGLSFEELLRYRVACKQLPDDEEWIRGRLYKHCHPGPPFEMRGADGCYSLIEEIRTDDGGTIILVSDITTQKMTEAALRASEARHRSLMMASTAGILHIRQDGRILFANAAIAQYLAAANVDALIGHDVADQGREALWECLRVHFETDGDQASQCEIDMPGDRSLLVSIVPYPDIVDGALPSFLFTAVDISDRKRIERELSAAKDQAELANRTKTEFLANISHELRTPLNAIIGFSEIIDHETFGPIGNERYQSYIRDIGENGRHLLGIINDLLDISKIEAGKFEIHPEKLNISLLIDSVLRLITPRAIAQKITLYKEIVPPSVPLVADARAVRQILLNLLSNAIKFTPAKTGKTVRITAEPGDPGWYRLIVADNGIGIAASDLEKVLVPFGQVDSALNRRHQGTGLGLPLTRALTELHGGAFTLASEPGQGTTVTVCLPMTPHWRAKHKKREEELPPEPNQTS